MEMLNSSISAFGAINEKLLTTFATMNEQLRFEANGHIKKMLYFFMYAETFQNQYYNHFAFALAEKLLAHQTRHSGRIYERKNPLVGFFLLRSAAWGFFHAETEVALSKIDQNCTLLATQPEGSLEDVFSALIYLEERNRQYPSQAVSQLITSMERKLQRLLTGQVDVNCMPFAIFLCRFVNGNSQSGKTGLQAFLKGYYDFQADALQRGTINEPLRYLRVMYDLSELLQLPFPFASEVKDRWLRNKGSGMNTGYAALFHDLQRATGSGMAADNNVPGDSFPAAPVFKTLNETACLEAGLNMLHIANNQLRETFSFSTLLN